LKGDAEVSGLSDRIPG